ncbi:MAG: S9 family peptidase, partial [Acidobacteriota bacterium]|nr:S9 family peptidase [Acidobacteriota bacterium]
MRIPVFGLVVVFTVLSASAEAQDADNRLTLDLYLEYESVSDPRLSPDGQQVIYSRQWIDKVNDRRESSLWIMDADGSRNRFLVEGSGARWSPSGDRIAFVAEGEPKGSQVFVRWMDAEGATTQITRVERGPGSLSWAP